VTSSTPTYNSYAHILFIKTNKLTNVYRQQKIIRIIITKKEKKKKKREDIFKHYRQDFSSIWKLFYSILGNACMLSTQYLCSTYLCFSLPFVPHFSSPPSLASSLRHPAGYLVYFAILVLHFVYFACFFPTEKNK
jgi:hypothetical protein